MGMDGVRRPDMAPQTIPGGRGLLSEQSKRALAAKAHDVTNLIFTPLKWFSFDAPKTFHGVLQNISSWEIQEPISRFPFPECWQLQDVQFPTRPFPISHFPLCLFHKSTSNFPFPISHLVPGISCWGAISRFPFPTSHSSSCVEAHIQFPISHFPQPWNWRCGKREE